MMAATSSLQLFHVLRPCNRRGQSTRFEVSNSFWEHKAIGDRPCMLSDCLSSCARRQDAWSLKMSKRVSMPLCTVPTFRAVVTCKSLFSSGQLNHALLLSIKPAALSLTRAYNALQGSPLVLQCAPAVGLMAFSVWGLEPSLQVIRHLILRRNAHNWKRSSTYHIMTSYLQPILLWLGAILICRAFDPVVLSSETSQAVKQRLVNFVRSLSTVLAFAYCISSLIQQAQKFVVEHNDTQDTRHVGFNFIGKAIYTAVWVAAVSLFMELLGFSTQKWITAGGLGTVLLTLAGREIFTNFLSSVMIHATRPFVVSEWIQTKIDGYEVSGTVEHVGWWSPTIVRGDDREAVHIPNHKFTVSVVRNLTQKSHWRIKTHLAISHLDVSKIGNIVADMRKVLAKNHQVEQQRLHRRVFLDNIDPENQALLILVSCFVKTPHFEEYLCVKEAILLDLLRVISHHRARLATPIRTVQKVYGDSETQNIPFEETILRKGVPKMIESPKLTVEDKVKQRSLRSKEELNTVHLKAVSVEAKGTEPGISSSENTKPSSLDGKNIHKQKEKEKDRDHAPSDLQSKMLDGVQTSPTKPSLEGLDSMGLNSKDITLLRAAFEKPPVIIPEAPRDPVIPKNENGNNEKNNARSEKNATTNEKSNSQVFEKQSYQNMKGGEKNGSKLSNEVDSSTIEINKGKANSVGELENELRPEKNKQKGQGSSSVPSSKHENERSVNSASISRPLLEQNLPLGVALDGPKRTLPIEGAITSQVEQKELAPLRNGNSSSGVKDRREPQSPSSSSAHSDEKDQ